MKLHDVFRVDCGCVMGISENDEFVIEPCSMICSVYQYVLEESGRQNKRLEFRHEVPPEEEVRD